MASSQPSAKRTRSHPNPDVDFPKCDIKEWKHSGHLLSWSEVIGGVRSMVNTKISAVTASTEISKIAVNHWIDRNVYPQSWQNVQVKLLNDYTEFMNVRKLLMKGSCTQATLDRYADMKSKKDQVYDIYTGSSQHPASLQRKKYLQEALNVRMGPKEYEYVESQLCKDIARSDSKKIICIPNNACIDPVWAQQQQRKEKRQLYYDRERQRADQQFATTRMEISDSDTDSDDNNCSAEEIESGSDTTKKKRIYIDSVEDLDDLLPQQFRHVRTGERKVQDKFYLAAADLIGEGLSPREALLAIEVVSNRCFARKFTQLDNVNNTTYDKDTLPSIRAVRDMVERIEVQGLAAAATEIQRRRKEDEIITHASDSTSKQSVGKFNVSGIHVNRSKPLPLPVVPVAGEAREEIAEQVALGFHILAAACNPPVEPAELYKLVNLHMTDSVAHNKFLHEDVPKLFDLDLTVGQIFCATHTGLGMCRSLNTSIHRIEQNVGISNVMDGFMVHIDFQTKNGSIIGQFVDCITRLVSMQYKHKSWNKGEEFKRYCSQQGISYEMFLYKDERFGCFPKACAVCVYSLEALQDFLKVNSSIDNRLACLVRDICGQEYAQLVMAVVAAFGIHLIEPFHAVTIHKESTHRSLQTFFKELYQKLCQPITPDFFLLDMPWYPGISQELFTSVKEGYKTHVVQAVQAFLSNHVSEAIKLANYCQPDLALTLARQRRDYGVSEDFEAQFPVESLSHHAATNAPVHNLAMENLCGLVGHRTKKNRNLEATSRSIVIQGTKELREQFGNNFRDYAQAVKRVKNIKLQWSKQQDSIAGRKIQKKLAQNLKVDGRLLKQLEHLKSYGGPFTSSDEVDQYLQREDISDQVKKTRMKTEVQYSRDSSLSVPSNNPVFQIRHHKGKELTADEFGKNLKTLIDKKCFAFGKTVSIATFVSNIDC